MNNEETTNTAVNCGSALNELLGWIPTNEKLPTDDVLAVYKTSYGRRVIIKAFYAKEFEVQQNYDDCVDLDYCETTEDYYLKAGWYECISNWEEYSSVVVNDGDITHWMPMPELPRECA